MVSICYLCRQHEDTSAHLFLNCPVSMHIWHWLNTNTNHPLNLTDCTLLLIEATNRGSKLEKQLMTFSIVHIIWAIWIERNNRYFNDKSTSIPSLINGIISEVKLSYSLALTYNSSPLSDFHIANLFGVPLRSRRSPAMMGFCGHILLLGVLT